jgi:tRNA(Ile)-lysidine synthase
LRWEDKKPRTGLAEAAREARYRLIEEHACSIGSAKTAVVTAHHLDDQAETFAMRLARGAGVDGLASMRPERRLSDASPVMLVRPLLGFSKARLVATVRSRNVDFVEDPSNQDVRSERVRVRQMLSALDAAGIRASALARSARRLNEANAALLYAEEQFVATLDLSFGNEVFAAFDKARFGSGPSFLRQRVLARLIARFGGASPKPRLSEIEELTARLEAQEQCTATLGGAMISAGRGVIRVWREAGRLDHREIELAPGATIVWDQRFFIQCGSDLAAPLTVKPLGAKNYLQIADRLDTSGRPPAQAAHALPSFWTGAALVAVPSLAPFAIGTEQPFDAACNGFTFRPLSAAY